MPTTPRVSVIITTYNRASLLQEAIESVLAQSYRDFELIVADDGSTDDTAERVAAFGDRVRYVKLTHTGKAEVGRNAAITEGRGCFFAFLDDDDLWHEEKLARQMDVLERDEGLGYAYTDCRVLDEDGSISPPLLLSQHKQSGDVFDNLLEGCFVHPSTVVIRRILFQAVGPFDESLVCQGDYDLWLRAAYAAPVACVAEPLVLLRRPPDAMSRRLQLLNVESAILVLERLRRRQQLTWRQRWLSRRTLSRWHATLGLRREPASLARRHLLRSLRLNPLQRTAWQALITTLRPL